MNRWLERANWTMVLAFLGAVFVSLSNGVISWDALTAVGQAAHVRPGLAAAYPSGVDGLLFVAIITAYALRRAPLRKRVYVWVLIGYATAVSLGSNALHSTAEHGMVELPWKPYGPAIASTVPSVSWAATVHLLVVMRRALEEMQERVSLGPRAGAARRTRPEWLALRHVRAWRYPALLGAAALACTVLAGVLWSAPWSVLLLLAGTCAVLGAVRLSARARRALEHVPPPDEADAGSHAETHGQEPPEEPVPARAKARPKNVPATSKAAQIRTLLERDRDALLSGDRVARAAVIARVARQAKADASTVRRQALDLQQEAEQSAEPIQLRGSEASEGVA